MKYDTNIKTLCIDEIGVDYIKYEFMNISHIIGEYLKDVFIKYNPVSEFTATEIHNDFTKYNQAIEFTEGFNMNEVNKGVFSPIFTTYYNKKLCKDIYYEELFQDVIAAISKFMDRYGYVHYASISYPYFCNCTIISKDPNKHTCIIVSIIDNNGYNTLSTSVLYRGINVILDKSNKENIKNNKIDEKENNYMNFEEAYMKMLEGHKIARPCFKGYWYINGVTGKPTIHTADGDELTSGDLSITLPNVLAKDWIILE